MNRRDCSALRGGEGLRVGMASPHSTTEDDRHHAYTLIWPAWAFALAPPSHPMAARTDSHSGKRYFSTPTRHPAAYSFTTRVAMSLLWHAIVNALCGPNRAAEQATTSRSARSWALNSCSVGVATRSPAPRRGMISAPGLVGTSQASGRGGGSHSASPLSKKTYGRVSRSSAYPQEPHFIRSNFDGSGWETATRGMRRP